MNTINYGHNITQGYLRSTISSPKNTAYALETWYILIYILHQLDSIIRIFTVYIHRYIKQREDFVGNQLLRPRLIFVC